MFRHPPLKWAKQLVLCFTLVSLLLPAEVLGYATLQHTLSLAPPVAVSGAQQTPSNTPAFPGAEGYGAAAIGGRGGVICRVTTTADQQTSPTPGMFRYCMTEINAPRIILFDVAGEITLAGDLILSGSDSYVTVAGQTTPGSGITIKGTVQIRGANDVVMRYLRFRKNGNNNLIVMGGHDIIFDHISAQYAFNDNVEGFYDSTTAASSPTYRVTMMRSVIGPGLGIHATSGGWRGKHDYRKGVLVHDHEAIQEVDIHHNLFIHNSHRNPRQINVGSKVVNNVVYNFKIKGMESRGSTVVDWINNYLQEGPMSQGGIHKYIVHETYRPSDSTLEFPDGSIYASGNIGLPDFASPTGWAMVHEATARIPLPPVHRRNSPLADALHPITISSATQARGEVLSDVGANRRLATPAEGGCNGTWVSNQDALDAAMVADALHGTGPSSLFDRASAVGSYYSTVPASGYPAITPGVACPDSDGDGMPDDYENLYAFLNPSDGSDGAQDWDGDGWTNVEEYLNGSAPDGEGAPPGSPTHTATPVPTAPPGTTPTAVPPDPTGTATPVPSGSVSVSLLIGHGSDDGRRSGRSGFSASEAPLNLGEINGAEYAGWFRWQGVAVPRDATITRAYVELVARSDQGGDSRLRIRGVAQDNAAAPTSSQTYDAAPTTSAQVAWTPGPWSRDMTYRSPDLSAIVQEVVSRPGWQGGNALLLRIENDGGSATRQTFGYENGSHYARLFIEYHSGANHLLMLPVVVR